MTPHDIVLKPRGVRFMGRHFPVSIGKAGRVQEKSEGDGGTPIGQLRVAQIFYRPDRVPCPAPWAIPIGPRDLWCDAPAHENYNHLVKAPFAHSHEQMRRADPLYDIVITTDWNWPDATPGAGSAIFLHQWRRPGYPSEGCLAFKRSDISWIARQVHPGTRIITL